MNRIVRFGRRWGLLIIGAALIISMYTISGGGPFAEFEWWERILLTLLTGLGLGCVLAWTDDARDRYYKKHPLRRAADLDDLEYDE